MVAVWIASFFVTLLYVNVRLPQSTNTHTKRPTSWTVNERLSLNLRIFFIQSVICVQQSHMCLYTVAHICASICSRVCMSVRERRNIVYEFCSWFHGQSSLNSQTIQSLTTDGVAFAWETIWKNFIILSKHFIHWNCSFNGTYALRRKILVTGNDLTFSFRFRLQQRRFGLWYCFLGYIIQKSIWNEYFNRQSILSQSLLTFWLMPIIKWIILNHF